MALEHRVRVLEQMLRIDAAEEALPCAEDHRHDVHSHLVDEAGSQRLTAQVTCGHLVRSIAGELLGFRDSGLDDEAAPSGRGAPC